MISNWLPIETAPKDGTEIIAVDMDAPIPTPFVVCWSRQFKRWIVGGDAVCDLVVEMVIDIDETFELRPTRWMPVPEPPK